ncbi:MAG: DNA recombination protein RmuC [Alphaproteobacteria bacterium]|nr:DNA recombination protein RmuC [Alphaproteobacteria bacterium]
MLFALGLLCGLLIMGAILGWRILSLEKEKANLPAAYEALSEKAFAKTQEQFGALVDPVTKTLANLDEKVKELEKVRAEAYGALRQQIEGMVMDQRKLQAETAGLAQALRSPATRGQWGELQLMRCLEMAGLQENVHYKKQVSSANDEGGRNRPDIVIFMPGNKQIVIDAKAPMDAYLDLLQENLSAADQKMILERHARAVRETIKSLGQKSYWAQLESPEFVIMFMPGESYFSAALQADASLIEYGVEQKVIPASPTTLISLCKAVSFGWQQDKMAQNSREIAENANALYKAVVTLTGHFEGMGKSLGKAVEQYNSFIGSLERTFLPKARRFKELGVAGGEKEIDMLPQLENNAGTPAAAELTQQEQKKIA